MITWAICLILNLLRSRFQSSTAGVSTGRSPPDDGSDRANKTKGLLRPNTTIADYRSLNREGGLAQQKNEAEPLKQDQNSNKQNTANSSDMVFSGDIERGRAQFLERGAETVGEAGGRRMTVAMPTNHDGAFHGEKIDVIRMRDKVQSHKSF